MHTSILCAAAWLPFLFYWSLRWLKTKRLSHLIIAGITLALQFVASHPQIAVISAFAISLYYIIEKHQSSWKAIPFKNRIGAAVVIIVIGMSLAFVQVLPTYETLSYSLRGETLPSSYRYQGALQPQMLITMLFPHFFGVVRPSDVSGYGFVSPLYWGQGGAFWEMCGYVGIVTLLLSIFCFTSVKQWRKSRVFLLLGLIGIVLALGKYGILYSFFQYFPGASRLRFPSRFLLLWTFSIAILAGDGLYAITQRRIEVRHYLKTTRILSLVCLGLLILFVLAHIFTITYQSPLNHYGRELVEKHIINKPGHHLPAERYYKKVQTAIQGIITSTNLWSRDVSIQFLFLFCTVLILMLFQKSRYIRHVFPLSIMLLWSVDLGWFSFSYNQTEPARTILNKPRTVSLLEQEREPFRILSLDRKGLQENELLKPCFNVVFGIASIFTPGPMTNRVMHQWQRATGTGIFPFDVKEKQSLVLKNLALLSVMNVQYILTEHRMDSSDQLELVDHENVFIYRNKDCLPRFSLLPNIQMIDPDHVQNVPDYLVQSPIDFRTTVVLSDRTPITRFFLNSPTSNRVSGDIHVKHYSDHRLSLKINTEGSCYVRISDAYYPGWHATVDTQPASLYVSEGFFKTLFIEPGSHAVELEYLPFSFKCGLFLTLCSVLVIIMMFIISRKKGYARF